MSNEGWVDRNNHYLGVSLEWLRLRLLRLAPEAPPAPEEPPSPSRASMSPASTSALGATLFRRRQGSTARDANEVLTLPPGQAPAIDDRIREAAAEREAAARTDPEPALVVLARRLELSTFERDTLLLCAAMELDPGFESLCGRVQGSATRNYPTFALALSALEEPSWDALSAQRPLRYAQLVEVNQPGALPLAASPLRADERIVNFLKGLNALDERLAALLTPVEGDAEAALSDSQLAVVAGILLRMQQAAADSVVPIVQLVGASSGSKLAVAAQTCAALNRRLYRLGTEALPTQVGEVELLARLWQRESVLLPVALYVDTENVEGVPTETSAAFHRFLSRDVGVVFLSVPDTAVRLGAPTFFVDVAKPTAAEQRQAWLDGLTTGAADPEAERTADVLAGQFDLNLGEIRAALGLALRAGPEGDEGIRQRLWDSCGDLTRPRLDSLAQRLDPKATWDDFVLPDEAMNLLRQIAGQVRERHKVYDEWGFSSRMNRGFGISALFAGESGTGKTMAAEVIANDLRLNLYRIDLSAVVSKYIGETEKNLRKLFDAAEQGGSILFFDEADALFGKRSEVKDSHDRYANIEINYLLQRMEAFGGLAILATNMKSALDPAFMRRLRFVVNFQVPGPKERKLIWQKALPPETPTGDLDFDRLARLNVTGGNIHSIALNAAFMAAQDGQLVTMPILLAAARMELRKLEKPVNEAELR